MAKKHLSFDADENQYVCYIYAVHIVCMLSLDHVSERYFF